MAYCARCGHELAGAPVCDRCGTPAARLASPGAAATTSTRLSALGATHADTLEGAAPVLAGDPAAVPPPSLAPAPSNARFPLFADEVVPGQAAARHENARGHRGAAPVVAPTEVLGQDRTIGDLLPWLLIGVAAVGIVLVTAIWLLFRPGAGPGSPGADSTRASKQSPASAESSPDPGKGSSKGSSRSRELAATATALVPATAPPNQDVNGRRVRYDAAQLFDGDPTTSWRMPGDGTGALLTIRLAAPTEIREVGLVNGYAKEATDRQGRTIRWYLRNRRVTRVSWSFDDGSVVEQDLRQRPRMQTVDVGSEVTRTIRLRLLGVTGPMPGRLGRNFTAISEISLVGAPAR